MVKNQGSWARNCLLGMLALTFLCSGYIIPAARAESGDVGSLVAKVDRLGSSRYVTRVWAERSGSLELAREEAMRAIRYAAAQNSEALVSVSRTLAGDDYRERVRTLSAVGVTVRVVNEKVSMESDGRTLELIADVTAYALRQAIRQPELAGLYHLAAAGTTNWHAYACHLIAGAQARGLPLRATVEQVEAIATSAYPTPARRSANSRLACGKLQTTFDLNLPDWRLGVDRVLDELVATAPAGGSRK